jgi:site-specific recombinase XerD
MDGYLAHRNQIEKAKASKWLFVNRKGKELNPSYIYKCVTTYLAKVSTKEKVSPHVLRHTLQRICSIVVQTSTALKKFWDIKVCLRLKSMPKYNSPK